MEHQTEQTAIGPQYLVGGVKPVSARERLEMRMQQPLQADKRQKPLNIGLFDEDARAQLDLVDMLGEVRHG